MKRIVIAALFASLAFAQGPGRQPPVPEELKTALTLTDSQVTSLRELQQERMTANRAVFEQIGEKQQALDAALNQSGPDATVVGRLLLDIRALRAQIQTSDQQFQDQARGLLTSEQRTKLKALEESMKLQPAVHQAIRLNLLDPPSPPDGSHPRIGPGPGGPGGPGPGAPLRGIMRLHAPGRVR